MEGRLLPRPRRPLPSTSHQSRKDKKNYGNFHSVHSAPKRGYHHSVDGVLQSAGEITTEHSTGLQPESLSVEQSRIIEIPNRRLMMIKIHLSVIVIQICGDAEECFHNIRQRERER